MTFDCDRKDAARTNAGELRRRWLPKNGFQTGNAAATERGSPVIFRTLINALSRRNRPQSAPAPIEQDAVAPQLSQLFELPVQWTLQHEDEGVAMFRNALGDVLTVNYFPAVPDIQAPIDDVGALRSFYRHTAANHGLALIEVDTAKLTTLSAVRTLLKARMDRIRGFAFIGAYTLAFSDRSYVIKVESVERGTTGMREAAILVINGVVDIDESTGELIGWEQDPYDPSYRGKFMRNQADDPKFDAEFPEHPLTKVRRYLKELEISIRIDPTLRGLHPFAYSGYLAQTFRSDVSSRP